MAPASAEHPRVVGAADASAQVGQVLVVRDYAGSEEVILPGDMRFSPRGWQPAMPAESPMPGRAAPALSAAELARHLDANGRVVVSGLLFDGKEEIDPASRGTLEQIALLMKQRPGLRLHVVGHTDNVGVLAGNRELSKRRAHALCVALVVGYGIERNRLSANGMGSLAPLTSNRSEGGRVKNRRIELVVQ